VFLVADSQIIGVAVRLAVLRYSFRTIGYVKPTADINSITSTVKSGIKDVSKNDVLVQC
jgi:hypothetical protein